MACTVSSSASTCRSVARTRHDTISRPVLPPRHGMHRLQTSARRNFNTVRPTCCRVAARSVFVSRFAPSSHPTRRFRAQSAMPSSSGPSPSSRRAAAFSPAPHRASAHDFSCHRVAVRIILASWCAPSPRPHSARFRPNPPSRRATPCLPATPGLRLRHVRRGATPPRPALPTHQARAVPASRRASSPRSCPSQMPASPRHPISVLSGALPSTPLTGSVRRPAPPRSPAPRYTPSSA